MNQESRIVVIPIEKIMARPKTEKFVCLSDRTFYVKPLISATYEAEMERGVGSIE